MIISVAIFAASLQLGAGVAKRRGVNHASNGWRENVLTLMPDDDGDSAPNVQAHLRLSYRIMPARHHYTRRPCLLAAAKCQYRGADYSIRCNLLKLFATEPDYGRILQS